MLEENDGMSVTIGPDGTVSRRNADALPLPETYITCGKCKCLFAIAEEDLGTRGKGWLVSSIADVYVLYSTTGTFDFFAHSCSMAPLLILV